MLSAAITALGNRAWGHGPIFGLGGRFWGTLIASLGLWPTGDYPLWGLPLLAAGFYIFRFKSPHAWWDAYREGEWLNAYKRTLWLLPLTAIQCYWGHYWSIAGFFLVPVGYWLGFYISIKLNDIKTPNKWFERVALGELFSGAVI